MRLLNIKATDTKKENEEENRSRQLKRVRAASGELGGQYVRLHGSERLVQSSFREASS